MEIKHYIQQKKEIQSIILRFIEDNEGEQHNFEELCKIIDIQNLSQNHEEYEILLRLLNKILKNHYRHAGFFKKIEQIIEYLECTIKQAFTNTELFDIFKKNQQVLLILFTKKILTIDNNILNYLMKSERYMNYFYPELEPFLNPKINDMTKTQMIKIDEDIFSNFDEKRKNGENESYICQLIRKDSVEEFISYVTRSNISLTSSIKYSIFDTNWIFKEYSSTSLIEYAAYYGSIEIFQFLLLNQVPLRRVLWEYSIHGKNAQIIHLLEENKIEPQFNWKDIFNLAIKYHHNEIAEYILLNYINDDKFIDNEESIYRYYNFKFIESFNFTFLCKYNYFTLVKLLIEKNKEIDYFEEFNKNNKVALNYAAKKGCKTILDYLFSFTQTEITENTFTQCSKLTEIILPISVDRIENYAFYGCTSLEKISIHSLVNSIGNSAFEECLSLTNIEFPSSLSFIGDYCFFNCRSLKEIKFPSLIEKIGNSTFRNCVSLTKIAFSYKKISDEIDQQEFKDFCSLHKIDPHMFEVDCSLKEIGQHAFEGCCSLKNISIPKSIEKIGCFAFSKCSLLSEFEIHSSVTIIEPYTFADCSSLNKILIPDSIVLIKDYAFHNCLSLIEISLPSSIKLIGESAFRGCSSLKHLSIPSSVIEIEDRAFQNCHSLQPIEFPSSISKLGKEIFGKTQIENNKNEFILEKLANTNLYLQKEEISKGEYSRSYLVIDKKTEQLYVRKDFYSIDYNDKKKSFIDIDREEELRLHMNANNKPMFVNFYSYSFNKVKETLSLIFEKSGEKESLQSLLNTIHKGFCPYYFNDTCKQIILIGIAFGMKYISDCGMDGILISPSKILLDENFHPKINCSHIISINHWYNRFYIDDKEYYAPEFIYDDFEKTNVYSFAFIMYEIVTESIPFEEYNYERINFNIFFERIREGMRPEFKEPINDSIKNLICKCWSNDPKQRPSFKKIFRKLAYNEKYYLDDVNVSELMDYVDEITS